MFFPFFTLIYQTYSPITDIVLYFLTLQVEFHTFWFSEATVVVT